MLSWTRLMQKYGDSRRLWKNGTVLAQLLWKQSLAIQASCQILMSLALLRTFVTNEKTPARWQDFSYGRLHTVLDKQMGQLARSLYWYHQRICANYLNAGHGLQGPCMILEIWCHSLLMRNWQHKRNPNNTSRK